MKFDATNKYKEIPILFLKSSRAILGLTQWGLSAKLGVPRWAVANWESGRTIPKATVIIAIKRLLKQHRRKQDRERGNRDAMAERQQCDMAG